MEKFVTYFNMSKVELAKVIFPTKPQIKNAYVAVFLVVLIISLFLALVDAVMSLSLSALI